MEKRRNSDGQRYLVKSESWHISVENFLDATLLLKVPDRDETYKRPAKRS